MSVVPKHTVLLWPTLNLKWFNYYLHIPSCKVPTIRHVWQLIWHGDCASSMDLQDAYFHIPVVKHHCHFYSVLYQWKVLPFQLATASRFFTGLTRPILFLCSHRCFCNVIYLDGILVLAALSSQVRAITHFCVPYWFPWVKF